MTTDLQFRENVPLAPFTTLGIGGNAHLFLQARTEDEVVRAIAYARNSDVPLFILGGGSNIVVADSGFNGLVVQINLKGISEKVSQDGNVCVTAQAGEDWDNLVARCVSKQLQGIECLSGIPGFVGGTPVQNVGAYGQEVSESIVEVRALDRSTNEIVSLDNAACSFSYRKSIFNTVAQDRYVVLAVTYALKLHGEPNISYRDLLQRFAKKKPSLAETRAAVLAVRRSKSMVIDESDPNSLSAGSFFKNPIVTEGEFEKLEAAAVARGLGNVPSFPAEDGRVKVPAAWLIEKAGFRKGYKRGKAGLSSNHTLALINLGGASAADIIALKDEIQASVEHEFSICLHPEPIFVGF